MPLHDWTKLRGWSGLHIYWMVNICDDIKSKLPPGFRAYLGSSPIVAIDDPPGQPDVSVRQTNGGTHGILETGEADPFQPDWEGQVATIEAETSVYIERNGRLIAAVELISPGNKDGTEKKSNYTARYLGYLTNGVHLLFVDLHPRPLAFSFADEIAKRLDLPDQPALRAPYAVSYRVNADASSETTMAVRRFALSVGDALPLAPLAIGFPDVVLVDLESTYHKAATAAYVE